VDCWTPARVELKRWMATIAPSLAELYEGAVSLIFEHHLPGYTRFVGHAVREIGNRLPDAMYGASSKRSKRLEYREELDAIVQLWTQAGLGTDGTLSSINAEADSSGLEQALVPLPLPLALAIATLIFEHEATKQKPIDRAARLFVGFRPENEKYLDTIRPTVRQWDEVTKWFMKITHESYRSDNAINEAELKTKFDSFEIALIAISQKFFTTTDALDEILEEANS